jgi:diguanylate cyclase (GGDEF)-like protein
MADTSPAELSAQMAFLQKIAPHFLSLYVTDVTGKIIASSPADSPLPTHSFDKTSTGMSDVIYETRALVPGNVPAVLLQVPILRHDEVQEFAIGAVDTTYLADFLRSKSINTGVEATLLDSRGRVIASTHPNLKPTETFTLHQTGERNEISSSMYSWQPPRSGLPEVDEWAAEYFVKQVQTGTGSLIIESSTATTANNAQFLYLISMIIMVALTLLTFAIANVISKRFTSPLSKLAQVTTDLPGKFLSHNQIDWPNSSVLELDSLVHNFRSMTAQLEQMFSEINQAQDSLVFLAHYDPLTKLPNRVLLRDRLVVSLAQAHAGSRMIAVLFIDLDRFKNINDTLGHDCGDLLLKEVAKRLCDCITLGDTVARQGGDEFTVILASPANMQEIAETAQEILNQLAQPFMLGEHELFITTSIGISVFPSDGDSIETLVKHADMAMYRAKELGRDNYQFYHQTMNDKSIERLVMENSLRRALEREEFLLHYQPRIDIATGKIAGMEALVRWLHPELGLVPPGQFIPMAEETGLIVPIGEWVLRTACAQNKAWQEAGLPPMRIGVNLSARQFQKKDLVDTIARILEETKLPPQYLELEITETIAMHHADQTIERLQELKEIGVHISIDDFGTGYSSLNYLKRFPVDTLKIDKSFIRDIGLNANDETIVSAVIALAHSFQLKTIAEGVETPTQFSFLQEMKCDQIQGYLFSPPVPTHEFEKLLLAEAAPKAPIPIIKKDT